MPEDDEAERKAARNRELLEEWLRRNRAETARQDLTDAAPETDKGTATETQVEAIDRAAHTPAFHSKEPLFPAEDQKRLSERARDYAELYPTPEAWAQSFPELARPQDPALRAQHDDLAELKKEAKNVTPEQTSKVDRMLADTQLSDKIGGATNVSSRPQPNDPTPLEQAKGPGQQLHQAGVTLDK